MPTNRKTKRRGKNRSCSRINWRNSVLNTHSIHSTTCHLESSRNLDRIVSGQAHTVCSIRDQMSVNMHVEDVAACHDWRFRAKSLSHVFVPGILTVFTTNVGRKFSLLQEWTTGFFIRTTPFYDPKIPPSLTFYKTCATSSQPPFGSAVWCPHLERE